MIKSVQWSSRSRLSCVGCAKADVILCLKEGLVAPVACAADESLVPGTSTFPFQTIKAELTNYIQDKNGCDGGFYRYIFNYDTDLIVGGAALRTCDIEGVVCEGCLTQYIDDRVGNEIKLEQEGNTYTLVTQHGCQYQFTVGAGGESSGSFLVFREDHGLGDDGDIVLLQGNFSFAQGDDPSTTADIAARILTPDTFEVLSPGIHQFTAHGKTLGLWYALSPSAPGESVPSNTLTIDEIRQNAFLPISPDHLYVDLQEADLARSIPEAFIVTKNSHGFVVGQRVSLFGGVWQPGIAGEVAYFVKEILDVNTFVVSFTWSGISLGAVAGTTYALDPANPGQIVDINTLNTASDPITRIGFSPKTNYLLGFIEYPVIRGVGSLPDVVAPTVSSAVVPPAGTTLILTFSEPVLPILAVTGFTVESDGNPVVVSSASRTSSNVVTLVLATTILPGDVTTYDYSPGNVTDASGNALAAIVNGAVTNNASAGGSIFFNETLAGGMLVESYSELVGPLSPDLDFINAPGVAPLGDYYLTYTQAGSVGYADFETFRAGDIISVPVPCLEFETYIAFIEAITGTSEIFSFSEADGSGNQSGLKIRIGTTGGDWQTRIWNNADGGSPIDVFNNPAGASPVVNKWYKITGSVKMSSAMGVADGELNYTIQPLQGNIASTTGADDGPAITVNNTTIITHNSVAPGLFSWMRVTGGYMQKSVTTTNPWGIAFGGFKANVCP